MDVVMALVCWLSHYRALFSAKCAYCNKILVADTCAQEGGEGGTHGTLAGAGDRSVPKMKLKLKLSVRVTS